MYVSSVVEQAKVLGKSGLLRTNEGLLVPVRIIDVRTAFGNLRYEVEPIGGEGTARVDAFRVEFVDEV